MKERPILFSVPMVRAILDGSKTQTRRIVKGQPPAGTVRVGLYHHQDPRDHFWAWNGQQILDWAKHCPYGQPGDRLWVRETSGLRVVRDGAGGTGERRVYRASDPDAVYATAACGRTIPIRWIPSIHMPRAASRIDLLVKSVRVERLQDINEADCWAEGIEQVDGMLDDLAICNMAKHMDLSFEDPAPTFAALWESINGAGSWQANPWVWVVEFERIKP